MKGGLPMSLLAVYKDYNNVTKQINLVETRLASLSNCPYTNQLNILKTQLKEIDYQIDSILLDQLLTPTNCDTLQQLEKIKTNFQKEINSLEDMSNHWMLNTLSKPYLSIKLKDLRIKQSQLMSSLSKEKIKLQNQLDLSKFIHPFNLHLTNSKFIHRFLPFICCLITVAGLEIFWTHLSFTFWISWVGTFLGTLLTFIGWCLIPLIGLKLYPLMSIGFFKSMERNIFYFDNPQNHQVIRRFSSSHSYKDVFINYGRINKTLLENVYEDNQKLIVDYKDYSILKPILLDLIERSCLTYVLHGSTFLLNFFNHVSFYMYDGSFNNNGNSSKTHLSSNETLLMQHTIREIHRSLKNYK